MQVLKRETYILARVKNQLIESWFSDNILLDRQFTVMLEKSCLLTFLINKMGIILAKAI